MNIRHIGSISGRGLAPDQFSSELRGIHVDRAGRVGAVGDSACKLFDDRGKLLRRWNTDSPASCITSDSQGRTWLGGTGLIEIYDDAGKRLEVWRDSNRLGCVTAIDFTGEDVLVADSTHRCIHRFDQDRRLVNEIGADNNTHGFLVPNGHLEFALDSRGIIHAANPGKYRIERYTLAGELLGHFGRFGTKAPADFPGCCNPTNMTLLSDGRVVVTEKAPPRLKIFDPSGKMLGLVGPEAFDANCRNMDVAVDAQGLIHVVDTVRLCIHLFACDEPSTSTRPATAPKGGMAHE